MLKTLFLILIVLAGVALGAAVGLRCSPYIARRLGFSPFQHTTIEGAKIPEAVEQLIASARSSVLLQSETIDNRRVLDALAAACQRRVSIGVVLSGPANIDPASPLRLWLAEHSIPTRLSSQSLPGTILVIDRASAAVSSVPLFSTSRLGETPCALFIFAHKATADSYFNLIVKWSGLER